MSPPPPSLPQPPPTHTNTHTHERQQRAQPAAVTNEAMQAMHVPYTASQLQPPAAVAAPRQRRPPSPFPRRCHCSSSLATPTGSSAPWPCSGRRSTMPPLSLAPLHCENTSYINNRTEAYIPYDDKRILMFSDTNSSGFGKPGNGFILMKFTFSKTRWELVSVAECKRAPFVRPFSDSLFRCFQCQI